MTNETQKIIEAAIKSYREGQQAAADSQASSTNNSVAAPELPMMEDPYAEAPEYYPPELSNIFRSLPYEFRQFLHEHEASTRRCFEELEQEIADCRSLKEIYALRQNRLSAQGNIPLPQYFGSLAAFDDALAIDPESAIRSLAEDYGIADKLFPTTQTENKELSREYARQVSGVTRKLSELEQHFVKIREDFAAARRRDAEHLYKEFMEARDKNGRIKHEFFSRVKPVVYRLLATGAAADLYEAYEMAVWTDADIRAQMIAASTDASIKSKAEEAAKAKDASFSPKGHQKPAQDYSKMSTREVLESVIAQYRNK